MTSPCSCALCAESQRTQVFEAVVVSPTSKMTDSLVGWRRVGAASPCGSVAHGRHLRQSAQRWERRRPPARRTSRGAGEGRGLCRRPLCVDRAAGAEPERRMTGSSGPKAIDEGSAERMKTDTRAVVVDVPHVLAFAPVRRIRATNAIGCSASPQTSSSPAGGGRNSRSRPSARRARGSGRPPRSIRAGC